MPRTYQRRFDHDEARRLRFDENWPVQRIADHMGVTYSAVWQVTTLGQRRRQAARNREPSGVTCACGKPISKGSLRVHRSRSTGPSRCIRCSQLALATTVRPNTLRCGGCGEWKHDEQFSHDYARHARRHRARWCTACQTIARRERRQRARAGSAA